MGKAPAWAGRASKCRHTSERHRRPSQHPASAKLAERTHLRTRRVPGQVVVASGDEIGARLLASLAEVPEDELVAAAGRVARMRPAVLRRLLHLAAQPGVARLLDRLG